MAKFNSAQQGKANSNIYRVLPKKFSKWQLFILYSSFLMSAFAILKLYNVV